MFEFKYDEKSQAEKIINEGFSSNHLTGELKVLAKYFKYLGQKPKEREESLYEVCKKHLADFNKVSYFRRINAALNYAKKKDSELIVVESVSVYKSELDYIDNSDIPHYYKKVVFTLLILSRLGKQVQEIRDASKVNGEFFFGGNQRNYQELKLSSKTPQQSKRNKIKGIHDIIGDLDKEGIIEIRGRGYIRLSFAYSLLPDELAFDVTTFDDIGYYYDLHTGENKIKKCEECGSFIKVSGKHKKYCGDCAVAINKEKTKKRMREKRNV
ncbi:hypothetical protein [Priestia megaterium]|uniref:hypothetical protein n=1 Tax=Priestia megaterium TaxID=1404 RepID=UPI003CC548FE